VKMMKINNFRKYKIFICYFITVLFPLVIMPLVDLYGFETKKEETSHQAFLFENLGKNVPKELSELVHSYWKYKGIREFELAYEIEAPHTKYQISIKSYALYHAKARKLKGCRILNIQNSSGLAIVTTELLFDDKEDALKNSTKTQILNERWIYLNDKWYHVYVNPFVNIR